MKPTTHVAFACRNQGKAGAEIKVFEGPVSQGILKLAHYLGEINLAKRVDIVIARTEEEARNGIRIRTQQQNGAAGQAEADLLAEIDAMMANGVE